MKIDFVKACDCLEHVFLLDVHLDAMAILNFGQEFLNLVKGLLHGDQAKVHFNGLFMPYFSLQRGVRQGCSFLFYDKVAH